MERFAKNFFTAAAVMLWLIVVGAALDMQYGHNPTAINGVIGGSIAATFCTAAAMVWRKLWKTKE